LAWLVLLMVVPAGELKRLWPAALISLAAVYWIDSTLGGLGAFRYSGPGPAISGIPVFYLLSIAPGGIMLAYHYPDGALRRAMFVAGAAFVFLLVEEIMVALQYFHYLSWSPGRSYVLDVGGLIVVLWTARLVGAAGRTPSEETKSAPSKP